MRHFSIGARTSARQGLDWVSILALFAAWFAASTASAALTFDLRAVSGSQVTIHSSKSVGVTQNSVGGWIDFELHALVTGQNNSSHDEALHSFAGNIFSSHFGRGAVSGDLVNTGEIAARVRRGIAAPFGHFGYSDGWAQNLDGDPDLEIGGTGESYWNHNTLVPTSTRGAIIGRGNPFNVYGYAGDGGVADFLLYRFTLPIASLLAGGLDDLTSICFEPWNGSAAGHWREDGLGKSRTNGGTVAVGESVLIHTAETPSDVASIPEPGAWLLGTTALAGLVFARRRRGTRLVAMPRSISTFAWLATISVLMGAGSANAALTFDLRAVSGSQIVIHGPKSVAVNQFSVGGWIDFELWAIVTGDNAIATDDGMQNFVGSMFSTHAGRGAGVGDMINAGEPRVRRGVLAPFDGTAHQNGNVQKLDNDPELEIGGTQYPSVVGMIAARTGTGPAYYAGSEPTASFPLYRFTLPIESVPAESLADMTRVHFETPFNPVMYIWWEDGQSYYPAGADPGTMLVNDSVLIHTADTPEELALIPEPGTWALGLSGMVGAGWFARRRRRR